MVLTSLSEADIYTSLHPLFRWCWAWLRSTDLSALDPQRIALEQGLVAIVSDDRGRGRQAARLEAHRRAIDVQCCIAGQELIGWRSAPECHRPVAPYHQAKDVAFYWDTPTAWLAVPSGSLAILWPDDAHAPLAGEVGSCLRKVVLKVPVLV